MQAAQPENNGLGQTTIIEERIVEQNGDISVRRYALGRFLGKGNYSNVYEVTNLENNEILAMKIIPKASLTKSRQKERLLSSIKIHELLQHTNIVQFKHTFEDKENVYILMELCANQNLSELVKKGKRLTEQEVQCYTLQIINALKYLHENRIIHRDLKLGHILLSDKMKVKLCGFGAVAKLESNGQRRHTICCTSNYIAPEIIDGGKAGYSYEVDIWSLGVSIYSMLVGKAPFETSDVKTIYKKIRNNDYSFPNDVPVSDAAKSLITQILNFDPSQRPTLDEILAHPFMNQSGNISK